MTTPMLIQTTVEKYLYNHREFQAYLDGRPCSACIEFGQDGCDCAAPSEWVEAAGEEAYTALKETLDTWVETLIAGRPYDTPLVEWEHRELDKRPQQAAEMRAEMEP